MKQQVLDYIDNSREEMLTLWKDLVTIESGKDHKSGIDFLIGKIDEILRDENFRTKIVPYEHAGNAIVAESGDVDHNKPILLIGHVDTVFPKGFLADHPFHIKDDKAYGPGVSDMKGGVVAILYAVKALKKAGFNTQPLKVIIVGDEEDAHINSEAKSLLLEETKGGLCAFNTETGNPDNNLYVGRAGGSIYELEVYGVASHTGINWEEGRNAIIELSKKMIDIDAKSDHDAGYTYNVTMVKGGTATNACPDYAKATIGTRCQTTEQQKMMQQTLQTISDKTYIEGTDTTLTFIGGFDPMEVTEGNQALFQLIQSTAEDLNMEPLNAIAGQGSSDSAYSAMAGVPTVCSLGPIGKGEHTPNEYALIESLFERCKLLAASILKVPDTIAH